MRSNSLGEYSKFLDIKPIRAINDARSLPANQIGVNINVVNNDITVPANRAIRVDSVIKINSSDSPGGDPGGLCRIEDGERISYRRAGSTGGGTAICEYEVCTTTGTRFCDTARAIVDVTARLTNRPSKF